MKKIILVGFGPHAKRIYFPLVEKFQKKRDFELVLIIDLEEKREDILKYFADKNTENLDMIFIKPEQQTYEKLHPELEKKLDKIVSEKKVDGIIISTEPLVHLMYAKWALKNDLSIIMDKPISAYENISTNIDLAKKLIADYDELSELYRKAIKRKSDITFSIMTQRRFHPAFKKVKELISDCFKKTNCPVTSVQTFHCDGQWRIPQEIVENKYHPFMQGYGKCCHSGYHFFDIVPYFLEAATNNEKYYDNIDVFTTFVRPLDFLEQLNFKDYEKIFGKEEFNENNKYGYEQLEQIMKSFGEIDAYNMIGFKKGNKLITVASVNLVHNGFSKRSWVSSKYKDLYKGNGRVRHEFHMIEQGPFQSIHIHSYQAEEVDPNKTDSSELYNVGGEFHLEIFIFRNAKIIGGKTFEKINIKDLCTDTFMSGRSRGHQEDARALGFLEFIESLNNERTREQMTSDFFSHKAGVVIASAIYQSAIARTKNESPLINIGFNLK